MGGRGKIGTMDNKARNEAILKTVCNLLEEMNVEVKDAFVEDVLAEGEEVEGTEQVLVGVEVESPAILIGFKGRTLSALQFVMSLMVKKELDRWVRILLDINGYRGEQKNRLEDRTAEAIKTALESGRVVRLPEMSSFERRLCHMVAAKTKGVVSESEGEGRDRHVVIKPEVKEKKETKKKKTKEKAVKKKESKKNSVKKKTKK